MQRQIRGVSEDSCIYFLTASQFALKNLFFIISCGHFYCDRNYSCIRRGMDNIQVLYIASGKGTLQYDGRFYSIKEGDCFIIDCNIPHSYFPSGHWETVWCHFDGLSTRAVYAEIFQRNGPVMTLSKISQIPELISSIVRIASLGEMNSEIEISCLIHQILSEAIIQIVKSALGKETPVSLSQRYIHKNFRKDIKLQDLCDISFVSKYYLCRLFVRDTGFSPYEFITTMRLNEAKKLLISTNMTVKEIAEVIGYSSDSNFSRIFSTYIRKTPGQFRKDAIEHGQF